MLTYMLLGMHAGLVYCMDYVESNMDWLKEQLQPLEAGDCTVACNQLPALNVMTLLEDCSTLRWLHCRGVLPAVRLPWAGGAFHAA